MLGQHNLVPRLLFAVSSSQKILTFPSTRVGWFLEVPAMVEYTKNDPRYVDKHAYYMRHKARSNARSKQGQLDNPERAAGYSRKHRTTNPISDGEMTKSATLLIFAAQRISHVEY